MFTSISARVSTNTYCLARTRRFSRRSENSVGRVTHEREAPTDAVQLVTHKYFCILVPVFLRNTCIVTTGSIFEN